MTRNGARRHKERSERSRPGDAPILQPLIETQKDQAKQAGATRKIGEGGFMETTRAGTAAEPETGYS